jgi:multidrug efflux pump subunit AcrA (membrane-fusion protein)
MFLRTALPLLALAGLGFALLSSKPKDEPLALPPSAPPPAAPYERFVAGTGMVEPASEVVAIASPVSGLIEAVLVKVGDRVSAGAPLLRLDSRREAAALKRAEAQLGVSRAALAEAEAALATAEAELGRQNALPRPEELPGV